LKKLIIKVSYLDKAAILTHLILVSMDQISFFHGYQNNEVGFAHAPFKNNLERNSKKKSHLEL
jgi:hypothetical protein